MNLERTVEGFVCATDQGAGEARFVVRTQHFTGLERARAVRVSETDPINLRLERQAAAASAANAALMATSVRHNVVRR